VEQTNEEISQAANLQKKSRKKYVLLIVILIFVVGIGLGAYFMLGKK
jgi:flagellar basal body-associated protein FliL